MYFDWTIFLCILTIFYSNHYVKKILLYLFIIVTFILTYYVIFLFDARTTKIIIILSIILTIIKYIYEKYKFQILNFQKINFYILIFFLLYIIFYFVALIYSIKTKDSSLMTRFFYWFVIYKYFLKNPHLVLTGLGEYQWGYLYRYLTFDLNTFPYISFTDYRFFFHSHAHNDIVSFLIGGGIIFLFLYFYIIISVLNSNIKDNKDYIFFCIIIIFILHGITEPISFSPYTGYIFWLFGGIFVYKRKEINNRISNKTFNSLIIIKKTKSIRNINFIITLFAWILFFLTFIRLELKNDIYQQYYFKLIPEMKKIYNNQELNISNNTSIIDSKINLLKKLIILMPFEKENYSIISDYLIYKFYLVNDEKTLNLAYKYLCISFYLHPTIFDYERILFISKKNLIYEESKYCKKLNKFDPYNILK
jgi:hypothetical protein